MDYYRECPLPTIHYTIYKLANPLQYSDQLYTVQYIANPQ